MNAELAVKEWLILGKIPLGDEARKRGVSSQAYQLSIEFDHKKSYFGLEEIFIKELRTQTSASVDHTQHRKTASYAKFAKHHYQTSVHKRTPPALRLRRIVPVLKQELSVESFGEVAREGTSTEFIAEQPARIKLCLAGVIDLDRYLGDV